MTTAALALELDFDLQQPSAEEFDILPPRLVCGRTVDDESLWVTATEWVNAHRKSVLKVGTLLLTARLCDADDLLQTAHIIAVEQCQRVLREGQVENFVPLFFAHLRWFCVGEWHQHRTVTTADLDWDNLPDPKATDIEAYCDGIDPNAEREKALKESFGFMTPRQQEVMKTLLGLDGTRGGLSLKQAARWFEVEKGALQRIVDQACESVARGRKRGKAALPATQDVATLKRELVMLQAANARLLEDNLALRRQLGRPAVAG